MMTFIPSIAVGRSASEGSNVMLKNDGDNEVVQNYVHKFKLVYFVAILFLNVKNFFVNEVLLLFLTTIIALHDFHFVFNNSCPSFNP